METKNSFITILGKASRSFAPEKTIVKVKFNHTYEKYLDACAALESNQKVIFAVAEACQLDRNSVSTGSYSISKDEVPLRDKNQNYTGSKLLGYELTQSVSITFDIDNRLMTDLLNRIIAQIPDTEISISYSLEASTSIDDELIAAAVADARRQAIAMSSAAGCKLGRVLQMLSGDTPSELKRILQGRSISIRAERKQILASLAPSAFNEPLEDNPGLITLSQSVTVIWELKE